MTNTYIDGIEMRQVPSIPERLVSQCGRVYSTNHKKWLKPTINPTAGHLMIGYKAETGKQMRTYVHRLVALAWVPNPNSLNVVDHIDGDPQNNHVTNLRWGTQRQNMQNRLANKKGTNSSCFIGVGRYQNKWRAQIYRDKITVALGYFTHEVDAAKAYDQALIDMELQPVNEVLY